MGRLGCAGLLVLGLLGGACGGTDGEAQGLAALEAASVTLVPARCAGVVVEDGWHVLTAAHCVRREDASLTLSLPDGTRLQGPLVFLDRAQDVAVVRLTERAPVAPLRVASALPGVGEGLLFVGRADRAEPPQEVEVRRLAPCPSLPGVPAALHTTLRGRPGDSGAPLVNRAFEVVGLVHGGAACSIAAPLAQVAPVLEALAAEVADPRLAHRPPARQ